MNNIILDDSFLNAHREYAKKLDDQFRKETRRTYFQLAGLVVGTVVGAVVAAKIRNL